MNLELVTFPHCAEDWQKTLHRQFIFVPGLCKYHQRQSLKGSSLNPSLTAFQSKCLDYYKLFVNISKNVLKAVSKKEEVVAKRRCVCFSPHILQCTVTRKNTEIQKNHQKMSQSIKSFQPGIHGMGKQQSFCGTLLVSSWIFFHQP